MRSLILIFWQVVNENMYNGVFSAVKVKHVTVVKLRTQNLTNTSEARVRNRLFLMIVVSTSGTWLCKTFDCLLITSHLFRTLAQIALPFIVAIRPSFGNRTAFWNVEKVAGGRTHHSTNRKRWEIIDKVDSVANLQGSKSLVRINWVVQSEN